MKRWIIIGIVVMVLAAIAFALLKPEPNAGDRSKLDRGFSAAEKARIDSVAVTPDQLAAATCDDGAACWILVDGVVYDMGGFPAWARGRHHGVKAGADCTEKFVGSGHAVTHLRKMPVVGRMQG